jgi:hypothetical protein
MNQAAQTHQFPITAAVVVDSSTISHPEITTAGCKIRRRSWLRTEGRDATRSTDGSYGFMNNVVVARVA